MSLFDVDGQRRGLLYHDEGERTSDPLANFRSFAELLRRRVRARRQNIVIIDASDTGEGKSTLGIQLARAITPTWSLADTAYSALEARALYHQYATEYEAAFSRGRPLPQRALLWDEGVLGLLSQGGRRNEELERTVQTLSIIRVVGVSVFLCIPRIRMLDAFVREGLAQYWLMVMRRGEARLHEHFLGAMYRRPDRLPYDEMSSYTPVGFLNMDGLTMSPQEIRAHPEFPGVFHAYELRKLAAIKEFLAQDVERGESRPGKGGPRLEECPSCGLRSNRYNVETHVCPGSRPGGRAGSGERDAGGAAAGPRSHSPRHTRNVPAPRGGGGLGE